MLHWENMQENHQKFPPHEGKIYKLHNIVKYNPMELCIITNKESGMHQKMVNFWFFL